MASTQSVIDFILKNKSIVEYLEHRDIRPVKRMSGGKLAYLCPMPSHEEAKPSFVVFTNGEYENFYCFGCHAGTTIIQLVAGMDNISVKEAIVKLSDGVEITDDMEVEFCSKRAADVYAKNNYNPQLEELSSIRFLSELCRDYLESVENDPYETEILDRFWGKIDSWISNYEFEHIEDIYKFLPIMLNKRREKYENNKRIKSMQEIIKGVRS